MIRAMLATAVLLTVAGCAAREPVRAPLPKQDLLSGTALFGEPVTARPIALDDVFRMDPEMHAFVDENVGDTRNPATKLSRLLSAMQAEGLFALDYSAGATRTVGETFHIRTGNCLSFTMLFVTLARSAGLDVGYQLVDVPPSWSSDSGLVVLANHINARVRGGTRPDYVVDFNIDDFKEHYDTYSISDRYAAALFYNNRGVEALLDEDYRSSFIYLRMAIDTDPNIAGLWVNLGILYARSGRDAQAESAYLNALGVDRRNETALTNLVALYTRTGDEERAELYRERVHRYQQQNPYYHYYLAREAYQEKRFEEALELVDRALRLKHDEQQFHFLQGLALEQLGESGSAEQSFARARRFAHSEEGRVY
jgi:Flp pilus assembly protein TadD